MQSTLPRICHANVARHASPASSPLRPGPGLVRPSSPSLGLRTVPSRVSQPRRELPVRLRTSTIPLASPASPPPSDDSIDATGSTAGGDPSAAPLPLSSPKLRPGQVGEDREQLHASFTCLFSAWVNRRFVQRLPPLIPSASETSALWGTGNKDLRIFTVFSRTMRVDAYALSREGKGYIKIGKSEALGTGWHEPWEGPFEIELKD